MNKPSIYFTSILFAHARSSLSPNEKASSCNDSLCWVAESPTGPRYQVLINGLKRGVPPKLRYEPKSRPWLSKLSLFVALHAITTEPLQPGVEVESYFAAKSSASDYQTAKSRLLAMAPFTAWVRNGEKYQNFDIRGNEVWRSGGFSQDQPAE